MLLNQKTRPFIPLAVMMLACGAVSAQECIGFWENDLANGGTNGATSVFAVDLNDDGHTDVLSASYNDDTIAWYQHDGNTPPQYTKHVIATDADGVASIYAVDIDGDGDIDVLSASPYDDTIALYESIGSGTPVFGRHIISDSADHVIAVYATDVDGDGDIDVLSASFVDNEIAWYENPVIENPELNPDGGSAFYVKHVVSSSVYSAASVFAADIDGDGDTDVLSASLTGDTVYWHKAELGVVEDNDGNEIPALLFTDYEISTEADGARSVFAADMDGDGDPDVLSASISDNKIAWYENLRVTYCHNSTTPCDVDSDCDSACVADPDSDGDTDCLNDLDSDGDEDGSCEWQFTSHAISNTAEGAKAVLVANINDDPYPDVLSASEGNDTVAWYENSGGPTPTFVEHVVSSETESADAVFAADLDSDGDMDILSASSVPGSVSSADKIAWFENSGAAPPWTEHLIAETAEGANALFAADIDGENDADTDDLFDLVAATSSGKVVWYEIDGEGTTEPQFTRHVISDDVPGATSVYVADLDGDEDFDVVAASADRDRVLWFANDDATPGEFGPAHIITSNAVSVESVFVADINSDGSPDVLSASSGDDKIAWYQSDGLSPPGFTERVIASYDSAQSPYVTVSAKSVFAADIDNDGDMDVLSASFGDDKISWFENDGQDPTGFIEHIVASADSSESVYRADGASSVTAADIDSDGDLDILEASANSATIAWYDNRLDEEDATIDFVRNIVATRVFFVVFVSTADVDGDGDMDVLSTSIGDDVVAWYENNLVSDSDSDGDSDGISFTEHIVDSNGDNPRAVIARELTGDGAVDLFAGFRFKSSWYEQIGERCGEFDVNGDGVMDGLELAWIGRAFGLAISDPPLESEWWEGVDYNLDGIIDGDDLAILATPSVWGEGTGEGECSYTCQ